MVSYSKQCRSCQQKGEIHCSCKMYLLDCSPPVRAQWLDVTLDRTLIGCAQPITGWWAPVAALYREVGAGCTRYEVHLCVASPTNIPTDLGF
jgi:hypothetical protein